MSATPRPESARIEPRLLEEMQGLESAGQSSQRIPVIIQHAYALGPLEREGRPPLDEAAESSARAQRNDLLQRLAAMAAGSVLQRLELANAIETHLTPAQIRAIAPHPDVKLIVWNREERVTT